MKKLIFAAFAAGAMVLAGCTKTEVTKVSESRAIGFDNFVSNSVKSIDKKEDLTAFYVYGGTVADQDIFNNQKVDVTWQGALLQLVMNPSVSGPKIPPTNLPLTAMKTLNLPM